MLDGNGELAIFSSAFTGAHITESAHSLNFMNDELQPLKDEIQDRIDMAREAIADAALAGDWNHAQAVTSAVKSLESSLVRLAEVRKELQRAIVTFDQLTKTTTRAAQTRLIISLDWRATGKDLSTVLIDEPTGAESLAKFLESLVDVLGVETLNLIQRVQAGGSGLVSRSPRTDFMNPASGELYGHKPIGTTSWYVKTHSSTKTKTDQIHQIKTLLGFPRHAVEVEAVKR
jgi:hypothetical protein